MGEARRRGTFEERKRQAVDRCRSFIISLVAGADVPAVRRAIAREKTQAMRQAALELELEGMIVLHSRNLPQTVCGVPGCTIPSSGNNRYCDVHCRLECG